MPQPTSRENRVTAPSCNSQHHYLGCDRVRIGLWNPCYSRNERKNARNRDPIPDQVWHDKYPSLLKGRSSKFC